MKQKLLVFSALFLCFAGVSLAQQDKLTSYFMYDKMSINPGETGIDDGICATSIYRNQWDKVSRAPNSIIFNVEANMNRYFPGGIGISFYNDQIGFMYQNSVLLNYSYPLQLPGYGTLGIGVGVGIMNFGLNPNWEPPQTLVDPSLSTAWSATALDMNFGLYFKADDDYYVGFSSTHLTEALLQDNAATSNNFRSARHYYLMGGKTFRGIGPGDIEANAMLRTDFIKTSFELNGRYFWNDLYGGMSFRTSDAIALLVGYRPLPDLTVGYGYDITLNKLAGISKGSHEILLKYCFYIPPPPIAKSKHPRWL
jgi:type IX secretion system PorP/SprF family membrane protein